jgi:UDP:flavonoid glycosyltransferase YjiC (YdhE family)
VQEQLQVPYDLIFPKIYGVIHHGGSGTTHMALKYGCASMIIPHIIDQFAWNSLLADLGVGPLGVKINKITTKSLEPKIIELMNNKKFKERAEEIKTQMAQENFKYKLLNEIIGYNKKYT